MVPPMIQFNCSLALSIVYRRIDPIGADRNEEGAEEHHLGRQEDPHPEGGGLALVLTRGILFFEPVPRGTCVRSGPFCSAGVKRVSQGSFWAFSRWYS